MRAHFKHVELIMRELCLLLLGLLLAAPCQPVRAAEDDPLAALVGVLHESEDPQLQLDLLKGMADAVKGRRAVGMPAGWAEVEAKLTGSANPQIRALSQGLGLTFGSQKALAALRGIVSDSTADLAARRSALQSLISVRDAALPAILRQLLGSPDLRPEALKGLAAFEDPATATSILAAYPNLSNPEKRDALNTLASRAAYARPLLAAVERKQIPAQDLTAEVVRQLRNLRNPEVDQQIQKVWGAFRETAPDKKPEIEKYTKIYRAGGSTPGDASRGRLVFSKICQQCHVLFDSGGKVGPDLTGSNRGDLGYILENMVDPNAVIPNDYRTSTVETKDERVITGIIKRQDDKSLTIVTANEQIILPRNEAVAIQHSEISMMPEGLLAQLSDQEVRDLIYYLGRPGQAPLPAGTK